MAAARRESGDARPRPRPTPQKAVPDPPVNRNPTNQTPTNQAPTNEKAATSRGRGRRRAGRGVAVPEPVQSGQVVAAAGNAIVTAARVGRLLGRSGWRIAKQLPGVTVVEQQTHKLRQAAAAEMFRLLEVPQHVFGTAGPEEQRVMMLVRDADSDPAPLRTAMTELLERSGESSDAQSRDYLFGTIVSQLVPDEARILATLAHGRRFAVVDVVAKQGRSATRLVLANASTVGRAAGISLPHNVGTYLTRLHSYGLLDLGAPGDDLDADFSTLEQDPLVLGARAGIDGGRQGSSRIVRKSVALSALGEEFWTACAPSRPGSGRGDGPGRAVERA